MTTNGFLCRRPLGAVCRADAGAAVRLHWQPQRCTAGSEQPLGGPLATAARGGGHHRPPEGSDPMQECIADLICELRHSFSVRGPLL